MAGLNVPAGSGTKQSWSPVDGSGASLAIAVGDAYIHQEGNSVTLTFNITYPTTSNTGSASISGVPAAARTGGLSATALVGGGPSYTDYATPFTMLMDTTGKIAFLAYGGTALTNANLSGKTIRAVLSYKVA